MGVKFYHFNNTLDLCKTLSDKDSLNHVSDFLKKWLNVENFNVLIGSGCSTPAIPLMNQTFKGLIEADSEQVYNGETFDPFIKYKREELESKGFSEEKIDNEINKTMNIEEYLDWLNQAIQYYKHIDPNKNEKFEKTFEHTIKGLAQSMASDEDEYLTNEEYEQSLKLYMEFFRVLFQFRSRTQKIGSVNVFTSNYDLFNEIALEQLNIHYTTGFKGGMNRKFTPSMFRLRLVDDENRYKEKWDPVRKFVKLYKLHGSLNWIENNNNEIVQVEKINETTERRMIYPYVSKHNLTRQTPYSELFREFSISMQKSKSVLFVMGYGFPDEHINQIIKQGLDNPDLTIIIFGNISEDGLHSFIKTNGSLQNLHIIGGIEKNSYNEDVYNGHYFHNIIRLLSGDSYDGI